MRSGGQVTTRAMDGLAERLPTLGLLVPRNATTWSALFVCSVSMAGAIYLILEMNRPFEGPFRISPAPLLTALSVIGQ
jgi:hypothetical protein